MSPLKILFAGTPPFAAQHLQALLDSPHEIVGVYTQPDRAAGRGKQLQASAVKQLALANALPVFQPLSLRGAPEQQTLASLQADLMIVVAYGLILPQAVLDIPRFGCLNVHASLLPRWRGAAPIERALLAGDTETGITIMQMDKGLDTGDMLACASLSISKDDDRLSLETRLAKLGCETLIDALGNLETLRLHATKQEDAQSTYAQKMDKEESLIHWDRPADYINRQIRSGIGRHPAYTFLHGERVRLLKAEDIAKASTHAPGTIVQVGSENVRIACKDSMLEVTVMQFPGKNPLPVKDLLNSRREALAAGQCFTVLEDQPS